MSIETIIAELDHQIHVLTQARNVLGGAPKAKPVITLVPHTKRHMSAAARKRISAAQKARWAKARKKAA